MEHPIPDVITLLNAEKLLNYMADINIEKARRFEPTSTEGLYILWSVEDLEFQMECVKSGNILFKFRKAGREEASGSYGVDEFIPQLEKYLLRSIH